MFILINNFTIIPYICVLKQSLKMFDRVTIKDVILRIGLLCKQLRQRNGLSQDELAEELGLSRYTIQKLESGGNATLDTVLKVAHHFDLLDKFYQAIGDLLSDSTPDSLY